MEQVFIKTETIKIEIKEENNCDNKQIIKTEPLEENYDEGCKSSIFSAKPESDLPKMYNPYQVGYNSSTFSNKSKNQLLKAYNPFTEGLDNNPVNVDLQTAYNTEVMPGRAEGTSTIDGLGKVYENGKVNRLTCIQCNKTFKNRANLKNHIKYVHAEDANVECSECLRTFKSVVYLRSHINSVHAKVQEVQCEHCQKIFMNKKKLDNHIYYTHRKPQEQVRCKVCGKTYKSSYNLKIHMRYVHPAGDPHPCPFCYKTFKVEMLLQRHMRWAHPDDGLIYKCQECHKVLPSLEGFKTHMKNVHVLDRATCDICRHSFKTKKSLVRHFRTVHKGKEENENVPHIPEDSIICHFCQRFFSSTTSLYWHIERYHNQMYNLPNNMCVICNTTFSTYAALHRHLTSVHSLETAKCQICFKEFKSQINLQNHIRITHAPPQATKTCEVCQKTFKCPLHLRMHIATVHAGGEFPCDICQKMFTSIKYLNKHKKSHSNSRDYQCDVCKKMYKSLHSVTKHKRQVHNGVKCTICNIKQPNIGDHMKKCHPEFVVVPGELVNQSKPESDHAKPENDQTMPDCDHIKPDYGHITPVSDHIKPESDYIKPDSDHTTPGSDHKSESDQGIDLSLWRVKKEENIEIDEINCSKCAKSISRLDYENHVKNCHGLPMIEVTIKSEVFDEDLNDP